MGCLTPLSSLFLYGFPSTHLRVDLGHKQKQNKIFQGKGGEGHLYRAPILLFHLLFTKTQCPQYSYDKL